MKVRRFSQLVMCIFTIITLVAVMAFPIAGDVSDIRSDSFSDVSYMFSDVCSDIHYDFEHSCLAGSGFPGDNFHLKLLHYMYIYGCSYCGIEPYYASWPCSGNPCQLMVF